MTSHLCDGCGKTNLDFCNTKEFIKLTKIYNEKLLKCPQCDKLAASNRHLNDHKNMIQGKNVASENHGYN